MRRGPRDRAGEPSLDGRLLRMPAEIARDPEEGERGDTEPCRGRRDLSQDQASDPEQRAVDGDHAGQPVERVERAAGDRLAAIAGGARDPRPARAPGTNPAVEG